VGGVTDGRLVSYGYQGETEQEGKNTPLKMDDIIPFPIYRVPFFEFREGWSRTYTFTIIAKDNSQCVNKVTTLWNNSANQTFLNLVHYYASSIHAAFAGHIHMDDFRVIYLDSVPLSYIIINPAISPLYGNNPAFKLNQWVQYLSINQQAQNWGEEYNFQNAYQINGINAVSLTGARVKILTDSVYRNRYIRYYTANNPNSQEITQSNWKAFWCGTGWLDRKGYAGCYCGGIEGGRG
jgi:sphingomyelin phosphodiesterase acid-like 3